MVTTVRLMLCSVSNNIRQSEKVISYSILLSFSFPNTCNTILKIFLLSVSTRIVTQTELCLHLDNDAFRETCIYACSVIIY